KPGREGPARRGDARWTLRIRPGPDGGGGARLSHVEHRRAVDGDPDFAQIVGDQTRDDFGRFFRVGRRQTGFNCSSRWVRSPVRWPHALDPPPFLVDENWGVHPANALAKRFDQRPKLVAVPDVALEEDEAPRLAFVQKALLFRRERQAGAAADERLRHRVPVFAADRRFAYLAMKHAPPSPFRRAHNAAASAFDRPTTRKR